MSNWDEMRKSYNGPSLDASCKILLYLAKLFQRRRVKYEKLTDDGRQVMEKAHVAFQPGEQKMTEQEL